MSAFARQVARRLGGLTALLLAPVFALVFAMTGCSRESTDRIRFGLPTAPATLDPRYATDAVSVRLTRLLHRALIDFDSASHPQPALATWRVVDPLHYRFRLEPGARFTDGTAITARDVVATYEALLDPERASPHRDRLTVIARVVALDKHTVEFQLHQADALFPGKLGIGVMAAADAGRPRDGWRVSSGAFEKLGWSLDRSVLMRRRSDGQNVEFQTVTDASVRALKLIGGELDIMQGNIPPEIYDWLARRDGLAAGRVPGATFSYLGFNFAAGPGARREVRLAVAHAIDRDGLIAHVFRNQARAAAALFPPEHWAGGADLVAPVYDPVRARALLDAAGYRGRRLRLQYKTSSDYFRLRLATAIQAQLAEVGIDLAIQSLDWGTFYGDVKAGRFELYGLSWVGLRLPDVYRYAFHASAVPPAGANRGRYREPAMDALIVAAENAVGDAARVRAYRAVAERVLYDLPYVPLWFEDQLYVTRAAISGYTTDQDGNFDALAHVHRLTADVRH